jgi:hypothetical protein
MKNFYTLLLFLFVTVSILAQAPEKMSYQAVLRDASNSLLTNQEVGIQISILQARTEVYIETQTATTNINGLVSIVIGAGTSSDDFSAIDWSAGLYFIRTATDPSGGSNYAIIGTSQLMSVPYALYAKTSGSATPGPQGVAGAQGIQGEIGATGTAGAQGTVGDTGATGADGAAGTNGTQSTYTVNTLYPDLGGYVIAVRDGGKHGLVVAMQDQGISSWFEANNLLSDANNHDVNGAKFMDWQLPTKRELNLMYGVYKGSNGAILNGDSYWSSSEDDGNIAWRQDFEFGFQNDSNKGVTSYVRAVRAF